jgi:hypothetical protein
LAHQSLERGGLQLRKDKFPVVKKGIKTPSGYDGFFVVTEFPVGLGGTAVGY